MNIEKEFHSTLTEKIITGAVIIVAVGLASFFSLIIIMNFV